MKVLISTIAIAGMMLSCSAQTCKKEELSKGYQWVRNNPFTITALALMDDFDIETYKNGGFNSITIWKPKESIISQAVAANIPVFMHNSPAKKGTIESAKAFAARFHKKIPNIVGWLVIDEPKPELFEKSRQLVDYTRKLNPERMMISTFQGAEDQQGYDRELIETLGIDIVMYDQYPFMKKDSRIYKRDSMRMTHLAIARKVALEQGIPYWAWIQTFSDEHRRYPSESELRMHVYIHLAAGFSGISYFTYDQWGMVEKGQAAPRPVYYAVEDVNKEISKLGETLKMLHSTDIRYVPGTETKVADGIDDWKKNAGKETRIKSIAASNNISSYGGVIGFFNDDNKKSYFMLVNLSCGPDKSSAQTAQSFSIDITPDVSHILRLNRRSGRWEKIMLKDGSLSVTLPGGTGDLFKFE